MPTLLIRFPAGRYHATPWGHHVNEGLVEWPPSPWRLIRALVACGYATLGWNEVPEPARRLVNSLSTTLPTYRLPAATVAHTRHYMPVGVLDKGREKTTLRFDTWAEVQDGVIAVRWDCELDEESRALFAILANRLGYLGRSESWVIAELVPDDAPLPGGQTAYPHIEGHRGGRGYEQVTLMAAEDSADYASWRSARVADVLQPFPVSGSRKPSAKVLKQRQDAAAPYPADLVECLQKDTAWWRGHRWSQPPGSRRVIYWRSSDCFEVSGPSPAIRLRPAPVAMMLLALTTVSGSRSALPSVTRTLPQAELLHRSLVARVAKGVQVDCPELTGRDATGEPLKGHRHSHILPVDLDGDGHLDHVVVHAPMGLGSEAQEAVRSLRRTWTKGGVGDVRVAMAGHGQLDALRSLPPPYGEKVGVLLGPRAGATVWNSVTPFVPPRFQKVRGSNSLIGQVRAELDSRGLPEASVVVCPWDAQTLRLRHAIRVRRYPASSPPVDVGFALQLTFAEPVKGPLSLGYGSHFGLGLFEAHSELA